MLKHARWLGLGFSLLACGAGEMSNPLSGAGGAGNTAGLSNSGGTASAGSASAAGAAGTAGSAGTLLVGASGASGASAAGAPGGKFAEVQTIFDDRCVLCHDAMRFGIPAYPLLSLAAGDAIAALVNQPAHESCGGTLVVPGDPDQSYLIRKLSGETPCEGGHMPRAYEVGTAPPLTTEQMTTIRSWISDGAVP